MIVPSNTAITPETYLGTLRGSGWIENEPLPGAHTYSAPSYTLAVNDFAYGGHWTIHTYQALAGADATIDATVQAKNVYMVLSPPAHGDGAVAVFIDGALQQDARRHRAAPLPGRRLRRRTRATRSTSSSRRGRAATRSRSASGGDHRGARSRATSCSLADVGRHRVDQVAKRPQPHAPLERRGGGGLDRRRAARSRSRRSRRACAPRARRRVASAAASSSRRTPSIRATWAGQSPRSSSSRLARATAQASGFAM